MHFVIGPIWFVIVVSVIWWLIAIAKNAPAQNVKIITDNYPKIIITLDNYMEQLDDCWRESLRSGGVNVARYFDIIKQMQILTADLSRPEQDKILMPMVIRNEEYLAIAKLDRNALKARLGVA